MSCNECRRASEIAWQESGHEIELEQGAHDPETNVIGDDLLLTGKIAWAHLKETRDYSAQLDRLEAEAKISLKRSTGYQADAVEFYEQSNGGVVAYTLPL